MTLIETFIKSIKSKPILSSSNLASKQNAKESLADIPVRAAAFSHTLQIESNIFHEDRYEMHFAMVHLIAYLQAKSFVHVSNLIWIWLSFHHFLKFQKNSHLIFFQINLHSFMKIVQHLLSNTGLRRRVLHSVNALSSQRGCVLNFYQKIKSQTSQVF